MSESEVLEGDCVAVMATLDAESVDAIVTDPPYGLEFMGRAWDSLGGRAASQVLSPAMERATVGYYKGRGAERTEPHRAQEWHERWAREALRVAKPGAHLLAFGGTRTYHRLAAAIEDAGWEIRDCLVWAYASGFPKSHNLTGDWQGWGTALKPAWEPIVLARKPLRGTVAANVTAYGTGALNIDGCRIGYVSPEDYAATVAEQSGARSWKRVKTDATSMDFEPTGAVSANPAGRWPANLILTDPIFDGDTPGVVGGGDAGPAGLATGRSRGFALDAYVGGSPNGREAEPMGYGDSGTYSRFFLIPKADRADREPVLGGLPERPSASTWGDIGPVDGNPRKPDNGHVTRRANHHPTVKPTELMRHLVRLVTPPGGLVLDPFLGSGTTALAAEMEGFRWLGIEREAEYVAIARARLNGTQRGLGLGA